MNKQIREHDRRLVVIIDPHMKANLENPEYSNAKPEYFVQSCEEKVFEG